MTDKEARRILIDIADQMPSDVCADWIDAIGVGIQAIDAQQTKMRDATEEERKSVKDYIESISKPTGVQFDAQLTDVKETIIKSALKGLVKMQIEEGGVGFAVDNDPDHDCCWYDILAWLEAQPTDITWVVGNDGAQVAFKNMPVDKAQQICAIIGDETQSTDADSSEFDNVINQTVKEWFNKRTQPCEDKGEISDGYHTFNQLYHQRAILFAVIVNQNKDKSWKSFKHSDGHYCFDEGGEMFIVGIDTPEGSYTYHYHKKYWDYFDCKELEYGKVWDGHTEEDVTRLLSLDQQPCRNCISRESVIEWLKDKDIIKTKNQEENARRELAELPSVTPSYNSIKTELKPCKDYISREEGIKGLTELINNLKGIQGDLGAAVNSARELIKTLPLVKPTNEDISEAYIKGYDYGVKDWFKSKTQLCEDCISREAVQDLISRWLSDYLLDETREALETINYKVGDMPSSIPERPKGKWIKCKSRFGVEYFKCSECGRKLNWIDRDDNYCNECGSDNSESTKEWFKEWDTKLVEITGGEEE